MSGTDISKNAIEWFQILGLGVALGMIGQGARAIIGLKKVNDTAGAQANGKSVADMIEPSRMVVSLMIGAIAGALAAITMDIDLLKVSLATLMGLAAAGYAGTDVIEGLMSRFVPKTDPAASATAPASDTAEG